MHKQQANARTQERSECVNALARGIFPAAIATAGDLEAHLDGLVALEPRFAPLRQRVGEVPLRRVEPGFAGLFWIITGQQISTAAGRAIFTRCEAALDAMSPECLAGVEDAVLRTAGQSAAKIRTLRAVSAAILAGDVVLDGLAEKEAEAAIAELVAVKGIGRWTAEVYLLFALGHADVFPAGDLALKEAARMAFALAERPSEKTLIALVENWRPHRSAAARLLWAYYGAVKRGDATPA
jgi:DNA-3-methyladenine glycosylase II